MGSGAFKHKDAEVRSLKAQLEEAETRVKQLQNEAPLGSLPTAATPGPAGRGKRGCTANGSRAVGYRPAHGGGGTDGHTLYPQRTPDAPSAPREWGRPRCPRCTTSPSRASEGRPTGGCELADCSNPRARRSGKAEGHSKRWQSRRAKALLTNFKGSVGSSSVATCRSSMPSSVPTLTALAT